MKKQRKKMDELKQKTERSERDILERDQIIEKLLSLISTKMDSIEYFI
jgi:hypothetical protein